MNIHPLLVHFPIALLSLYAIFEVFGFGRLRRISSWFYIKLCFLLAGFLLSLPTLETGFDVAEHINHSNPIWPTVAAHFQWARIMVFLSGILAAIYFLIWIKDYPECHQVYVRIKKNKYLARPWRVLSFLVSSAYRSPLIWILAILVFVSVVMTGALGASIVHGPNSDPLVSFVHRTLGL